MSSSSLLELVDYCIEKLIDYLYVFENGQWKWKQIPHKNIPLWKTIEGDKYKSTFDKLSIEYTMEYADRSMIDRPRYCSYSTAVKWSGNNIVLLNSIEKIDPNFFPYEAMYEDGEEDEPAEIFQFYITDLSDTTVEWSKKVFPDLIYAYSELLDAWILCVTHYGTSWDYVPTQYIGELSIKEEEFERFNRVNK